METSRESAAAPLKGLVLAGGRSSRMGQDKGLMAWHGRPQRLHAAALLEGLGIPAYISCRPDQVPELKGYRLVVDRLPDAGPLGALYSAFCEYPQAAWLVIACDMPLVDEEALKTLLDQRCPTCGGTAYRAPAFDDGSPDPLLAIWEPAAFEVVRQRLEQGPRCARKALLAAQPRLLEPLRPEVLLNVNTPSEAIALSEQLRYRS